MQTETNKTQNITENTYRVYTLNQFSGSQDFDRAFSTYAEAERYAKSIATKPVYNTPDPDGVYVLIYDDCHDSPRYTSW